MDYIGYALRGLAVLFVTVGIFEGCLEMEFILLDMCIFLLVWGGLEFLIYSCKENNEIKQKQEYLAKTGISLLSEEEKEKYKKSFTKSYETTKKEALQSPGDRYYVNLNTIKFGLNLAKGLAANDIQTGINMQKTDAPQADWAIAGGLGGVGAALEIMKKNQEATERQHQKGRDLVEQGLKSYQSYEESEKNITSQTYDRFNYSKKDSKLIKNLKVELIYDDNKPRVMNYGVGYIQAQIKIFAERNHIFPGSTNKAVIDGSVRVDLYDKNGVKLMASGYYCPPGRSGNDRTKTGFGLEGHEIITVILKEEPGVSFNKNNGCQIKVSHPNLWLLEL